MPVWEVALIWYGIAAAGATLCLIAGVIAALIYDRVSYARSSVDVEFRGWLPDEGDDDAW